MDIRQGIGYDLHRIVEGRPLIIGGIRIPSSFGLLGHSDADVLAHAITDALLGALALGDIGGHFPDSDPAYKNADSMLLLSKVFQMVQAKGYMISNIDSVIIAEKPKMAPYIDEIVNSISGALNMDSSRVSVKAKTNEGVDSIGEGLAIAAWANVLLVAE
ncbi:MAG: 2-C-methyl-D-erythritol 2,4-cyclodiphosphate synthase [Bacteroidetes bacterium HGW-Bacteroidetes-6]|jgi:2-C-methyl-D-erythritol 2,4-cyclodiphosphate synthase|nr:MAG: 2-C-methyl-D-erythritol 2,4-cyclodiphosphate synthase [Bacteroidetes bacterium HGW-Bacteroidetes-6]